MKNNILPKEMMKRSLSKDEIVLNYNDALEALDILLKNNFAFAGWEGWGKYADGRVGHCHYQGTVGIHRKKGETWSDYSERGYKFIKETIIQDYQDWKKSEHIKEYELYFCITVTSQEELEK